MVFGIPNTFEVLYLTPNTKYFQVFVFDPKIPNTQFHQILFQILGKYFLKKKTGSLLVVYSAIYIAMKIIHRMLAKTKKDESLHHI